MLLLCFVVRASRLAMHFFFLHVSDRNLPCLFIHPCCSLKVSFRPIYRMADAETLLMETSDQNGNEEENGQNGAEQEQEQEQEQELMVGEDSQDNETDGGKIDASKGEEDAG